MLYIYGLLPVIFNNGKFGKSRSKFKGGYFKLLFNSGINGNLDEDIEPNNLRYLSYIARCG